MRILAATILARDPAALAAWYRDTLGMAVVEGEGASGDRSGGPEDAAVEVGETLLCFTPAPPGEKPVYHFAFDIRENKIGKARKWLVESGVELLPDRDTGEITSHFKSWNAHAVYFRDPAGNIVELIARHDLPTGSKGPWDIADDILWISEMGLVVDSVPGTMLDLDRRHGLSVYTDTSDDFAPIGDEEGLLILVTPGRAWAPDYTTKAQAWPARVVIDAACVKTGAGRYGVAGANGVGYELVAVEVDESEPESDSGSEGAAFEG
jgi:catechol 2,3-dioxygenase-like lactoylglutathione lyase family enzyme